MTLSGFEKISKHCEILARLYEHLSFEDQLRLCRVSNALRNVFETAIWKQKYRSLTVISHEYFNYVVTNETGVNRLRLKPGEFQEFVQTYGDRVRQLTVINPFLEMEVFRLVNIEDQLDIEEFPNLTALRVESMQISRKYLELVARSCPRLECLHLDRCAEDEDTALKIASNLSIKTLGEMKHLKELRLEYPIWGERVSLTYHKLQEVMAKLRLESLKLDATIEADAADVDNAVSQLETNIPLRELYIRTSVDVLKWPPAHLATFQSLSHLTLENRDFVTDDILHVIALNCRTLDRFKLINTSFKKISAFPMPPNVTALSLYQCKGLNFANLKHLLTELKISKFDSRTTTYEGEFSGYFPISPLIQTLTLDCVYMSKCRLAFGRENDSLKELIWHHPEYCRYWEPCLKLDANITPAEDPLVVDMHAHLKSLLKLCLPHAMPFLNWPYVSALLRHPCLKELTISEGCSGAECPMSPVVVGEAFATNIHSLTLPLRILEMAIDFWLDLFARNDSLQSMCGTFDFCYDYETFLRKLIEHKFLPLSLRTIDVFGYTIDCGDLRRNFDAVMRKLYRENCEDLFRIILCKTKD